MPPKIKCLDHMRQVIRLKHLSIRTEEAYVQWAKRCILFHQKRHPAEMGPEDVRAFFTLYSTTFYHQARHYPRQRRQISYRTLCKDVRRLPVTKFLLFSMLGNWESSLQGGRRTQQAQVVKQAA